MKIMLWHDGFDGVELDGQAKLTMWNKQTNDFELVIQKQNLKIVYPDKEIYQQFAPFYGTNNKNQWAWLYSFPIESLDIDDSIHISPTWKPSKYGDMADKNEFQVVTITDTTITLAVHANGTEKEVFEKGNPYLSRDTNEPITLTYTASDNLDTSITNNTSVDESLFDALIQ